MLSELELLNFIENRKCIWTYSYVLRICAGKLTETTHTKEKILEAISSMFFSECSTSHIVSFAFRIFRMKIDNKEINMRCVAT